MSAKIFVEGAATGPDSKNQQSRLREAVNKLLVAPQSLKNPAIIAGGGRDNTFKLFATAHSHANKGDFVALLIDSEDPVADIARPWTHLKGRDDWDRPSGAQEEQVLFMSTCMETWLIADRPTLRIHYKAELQENSLPPLVDLEARNRHVVQDALTHATRNCQNAFRKGMRSFELLGKLNATELRKHLPSFVRCEQILKKRLKAAKR